MPTERVLVEVVTVANMAGIEQAQAGMLGLSSTTMLLGATLGVAIAVGKAGIENYKKQEEATNLLTQAYATQKDTLAAHKAEIERFLSTNAAFISDQYDTEAAMAALVRAGNSETDAIRILGDALDLAAIKHEPVSEAASTLEKVLMGNSRALRDLGISTDVYNAIMKDKTLDAEQKHLALLTLIETKTKDGRAVIDDNVKSQNELTIAWQNFTAKTGPAVLDLWGKLNTAATTGLGIMSVYVDLLGRASDLLHSGVMATNPSGATAKLSLGSGSGHRAGGGSVAAGETYTVGERGPETLVMGDGGGSIIPHGAGRAEIHIHMDGIYAGDGPSLDRLANLIAQRLSYVTGR